MAFDELNAKYYYCLLDNILAIFDNFLKVTMSIIWIYIEKNSINIFNDSDRESSPKLHERNIHLFMSLSGKSNYYTIKCQIMM